MDRAGGVILLQGAPDVEDLNWHENGLMHGWNEVFSRFISGQRKTVSGLQSSLSCTASAQLPNWRVVQLKKSSHATDREPSNAVPQTQFLSFDDADRLADREHLKFLEHSIVAFDKLVSSQILQQHPYGNEDVDTTIDFSTSMAATSFTDTSFNTSEGSRSPSKAAANPTSIAIHGGISNLKQIPAADYISSILPQTMTVHLIVGVVTVAPARTVHLRRSNAEMDIIELVVGDETRAGFTVSFWLAPAESQSKPADDLRDSLRRLRPGNVVLLQNVALSCFRNCVYGQSLSKRFARNSTLVTLLDDDMLDALPSNSHAKLQRVRDWISDFVGVRKQSGPAPNEDREPETYTAGDLPPDTQD